MDIRQYFLPLIRWWWLLAAATLLALVTSFFTVSRQSPIYQTHATLMIGSMIQDPNPNSGEFYLIQQLAATYADIGNRDIVRNKTMKALSLTFLPDTLVRAVANSQLIEVVVTDIDPQRAQAVANELAHQIILSSPGGTQLEDQARQDFINEQLDNLQTQIKETTTEIQKLQLQLGTLNSARQIADMQSQIRTQQDKLNSLQSNYANLLANTQKGAINTLSLIQPADLPVVPIGPNKLLTVVLASLIGFVLAALAAYGIEAVDDTYKSGEEIAQALQVSVIGYIPEITKHTNQWTYTSHYPRSPVADAFRILRTNLEFIAVDRPIRSLLITGSDLSMGKSVISANLALIFSQSEKKVILLDGDLRRPKLSSALEVEEKQGISDVCLGRTTFMEALVPWHNGKNSKNGNGSKEKVESSEKSAAKKPQLIGMENGQYQIHFMPAGTIPPNPADLLASSKFNLLLADVIKFSDLVIIDSPPLFLPDASVLLGKADGVIMVVELGHTRKRSVRMAKNQIDRSGAKFLGVVLNRVGGGETYYEKYHSYEADETIKKPG